MNFDEIRKNLDKIIAERMKVHQDLLFGVAKPFTQNPRSRAMGFDMGPKDVKEAYDEYMREDDSKTIILTKDDYEVLDDG